MQPHDHLTPARILIVDDQPPNVEVLVRMLEREGYHNLKSTTDSREALPLFIEFQPDLILLDLVMPHLDGLEVIELLRRYIPDSTYLPILVLTAESAPEAKQRALSAGARDFLTKPFDRTEVLLRIRNLLETRLLHRQLEGMNERLEEKVSTRTRELEEARQETLERLALAAERRDDDTGEHLRRVGTLSALVALALELSRVDVQLIGAAAPLHDVGKIGISDAILLKPGKLTPEEFDQIKTHSTIGAHILAGSSIPVLRLAEEIALRHHERWDGTGYPGGMRGEEIPMSARIVAVTDVYDALTHKRVYKEAWPLEKALEEIRSQRGRHFDPRVAEAFLTVQEGLLGSQRASGSLATSRVGGR